MLYGVEINEPYQINAEYKYRCNLQVSDEGEMSWTNKDARTYVTEDKATAEAVADTLAASWDAKVVPVEEGKLCPLGDEEVVKAFRDRAKHAARQTREIR